MARVTHSPSSRKRTKKILKRAKGFRGGRSKLHRTAAETVNRALAYSYRDRKAKKRTFRNLWVARINAACRDKGISYSNFMNKLKKGGVILDRKILTDLAVRDENAFGALVDLAKG